MLQDQLLDYKRYLLWVDGDLRKKHCNLRVVTEKERERESKREWETASLLLLLLNTHQSWRGGPVAQWSRQQRGDRSHGRHHWAVRVDEETSTWRAFFFSFFIFFCWLSLSLGLLGCKAGGDGPLPPLPLLLLLLQAGPAHRGSGRAGDPAGGRRRRTDGQQKGGGIVLLRRIWPLLCLGQVSEAALVLVLWGLFRGDHGPLVRKKKQKYKKPTAVSDLIGVYFVYRFENI